MVKRTRLLALVMVCWMVGGSDAFAWFGGGWLEKLSGPGPFTGVTVDFRPLCVTGPPPTLPPPSGTVSPSTAIDPTTRRAGVVTWQLGDQAWLGLLGCQFLDRDRPRLEAGVQYDWLSTGSGGNVLDYSHRPEAAALDKQVKLRRWMATADVRLHRLLDLGVGIGRGTFSADADQLFADVPKAVFQPVRVTLRPLAFLTDRHRLAEVVAVRVDGTQFLGGFDDADFGARPGTFDDPGELVWGWQITFDVGAAIWRQ